VIQISDIFGKDQTSRNLQITVIIFLVLTVAIVTLQIVSMGSTSVRTSPLTGASTAQEITREDVKVEENIVKIDEMTQYHLIRDILYLKSLDRSDSQLVYAEKITRITSVVNNTNDKDLVNAWQVLTSCIVDGCEEVDYYDFVSMIIENGINPTQGFIAKMLQSKDKEAAHNLIVRVLKLKNANKDNDLIAASQAITEANKDINILSSNAISQTWNKLIECDFQCNEYFDKILLDLSEYQLNNGN
jgi:hypothetical protein